MLLSEEKTAIVKNDLFLDDTPEVSSVALDTVFNAKFNIHLDNALWAKQWK